MSWHYFHYPPVSRKAMLERLFLKWWWINEHIVDHVQTGMWFNELLLTRRQNWVNSYSLVCLFMIPQCKVNA